MTDLTQRIRAELFANLAHYRQHCISETDDAETVEKFIEREIASRATDPAKLEMLVERACDAIDAVKSPFDHHTHTGEDCAFGAALEAAMRAVRAALTGVGR